MKPTEPATDGSDAIVDPFPPGLDSGESKLVYLYLSVVGGATIDRISNALAVKKITLYPLLRALMADGLVERSGATYVRRERAGGEG